MELGPGEPEAGPWQPTQLGDFVSALADRARSRPASPPSSRPAAQPPSRPAAQPPSRPAAPALPRPNSPPLPHPDSPPRTSSGRSPRPLIIAVDGRGGSGKTTLAKQLAAAIGKAAVVHSDDVAWNHARFDWDRPMIDGVLAPLHAGRPVHFQPPGWSPNGRSGHLDVPAGLSAVLIEGVGVSRRSLTPLLDATIWVQSDYGEARRRGVRRDVAERGLDDETALREWWEWEAEEVPFLVDDRPWERADFIVNTSVPVAVDAVALGRPLAQ